MKILIIDGHGLAHRGYSAMREKKLNAPDGTPTNMIYVFMNMLYKVQNEYKPDCTVVAFDAGGKTFRHELLPDYKEGRPALDDDFKIQLPILQDLLKFHGHKIIAIQNIEADDIIASFSKIAQAKGHEIFILTSDKDFFQLLNPDVKVIRTIKQGIKEAKLYDIEEFFKEFNFMPESFADYLAILGDKVDNIPGINGVGEKGAMKVVSQFSTLEKIFENTDKFDTRLKKNFLAADLEKAVWARDNLIKFKYDVLDNCENILDECLNFKPEYENALSLAERLALTRVINYLQKILGIKINSEIKLKSEEKFFTPEIKNKKNFEAVSPVCDLITRDYKFELKNAPEIFTDNKKIWDFKTAYYMLHPDAGEKKIQNIISEIKTQEELEEISAKLEGEIFSYENLHDVMTEIDLPLIPVLNQMEDRGVRLDPKNFSEVQNELEEKILELENEISLKSGADINLKSPKQVSWLLFERLGFTPENMTKGKSSFSTDAAVLEKLAKLPEGEIPKLILEHRELTKMLSGFVVPLQEAADRDGIIHTTFLPTSTGTGRLSSKDPNLQNIPAYGNWAEKIKSGLIPVAPGNIFVSADYSQIELRVLAHMSGEEKLIEAFKNGRDIHTETASWVFETDPNLVSPELRRAAKMINFGLIYGMSSFGLSERLGIARGEASKIIKKYFAALPGIQEFLDNSVSIAKKIGFSRTLSGRIRPVDEIPVRGAALDRALINSPIQGTAADIARRAMIEFERQCPGKLFLQVHDSLVCECSKEEADEVAKILSSVMKSSGGEISHLEVQIKIGKSLNEV